MPELEAWAGAELAAAPLLPAAPLAAAPLLAGPAGALADGALADCAGAEPAVLVDDCWPGEPEHAAKSIADAATRAVSDTARVLIMKNPP